MQSSQSETMIKPLNLFLLDSTRAVCVTIVPSHSAEYKHSASIRYSSAEYYGIQPLSMHTITTLSFSTPQMGYSGIVSKSHGRCFLFVTHVFDPMSLCIVSLTSRLKEGYVGIIHDVCCRMRYIM